jgi:hypothetical protein
MFTSSGTFTVLSKANGGIGGPYGGGGGGVQGYSGFRGLGASGATLASGGSAEFRSGASGGGGSSETIASGGGGGVGILGKGATGSGGAVGQSGGPGSNGQAGVNGNGGLYGGGGSGAAAVLDVNRGNGAGGAVAIRWGSTPVIYPLGAPDIFTDTSGSLLTQGITAPFQQPSNSMVLLRNFNIIGPDIGPTRILASSTFITVNTTDREMMLRNDDPNAIATPSSPQNFQRFEEVTALNDPRLVTVRVNNYIPGVTGEDGEGQGGGPPQIWY